MSVATAQARSMATEVPWGQDRGAVWWVGDTPVHQYWPLLAPFFDDLFLPPQRRMEGEIVAWSWREAGEGAPSPAELAALRKRLANHLRAFADSAVEDDERAARNQRAGLAAVIDEVVRRWLNGSDGELSKYVARTQAGLRLHSWAATMPPAPFDRTAAGASSPAGDKVDGDARGGVDAASEPRGVGERRSSAAGRRRRRLMAVLVAMAAVAMIAGGGVAARREWPVWFPAAKPSDVTEPSKSPEQDPAAAAAASVSGVVLPTADVSPLVGTAGGAHGPHALPFEHRPPTKRFFTPDFQQNDAAAAGAVGGLSGGGPTVSEQTDALSEQSGGTHAAESNDALAPMGEQPASHPIVAGASAPGGGDPQNLAALGGSGTGPASLSGTSASPSKAMTSATPPTLPTPSPSTISSQPTAVPANSTSNNATPSNAAASNAAASNAAAGTAKQTSGPTASSLAHAPAASNTQAPAVPQTPAEIASKGPIDGPIAGAASSALTAAAGATAASPQADASPSDLPTSSNRQVPAATDANDHGDHSSGELAPPPGPGGLSPEKNQAPAAAEADQPNNLSSAGAAASWSAPIQVGATTWRTHLVVDPILPTSPVLSPATTDTSPASLAAEYSKLRAKLRAEQKAKMPKAFRSPDTAIASGYAVDLPGPGAAWRLPTATSAASNNSTSVAATVTGTHAEFSWLPSAATPGRYELRDAGARPVLRITLAPDGTSTVTPLRGLRVTRFLTLRSSTPASPYVWQHLPPSWHAGPSTPGTAARVESNLSSDPLSLSLFDPRSGWALTATSY